MAQNYLALTGKVALITGASSGIGAATAAVMADLGARVAIGYQRNERGADEVARSIAAAGGTAIAIRADVRRSAEIRSLVQQTVDQMGPIDILVNNAGSLVKRFRIRELTEEGWEIAGHNGGGPGAGAYAAAKAGIVAFTKSVAKELAPHGIRVNAVSPGVIDTPFHEVFSTPEMIRNFVATIPLGRVGRSAEVAKVIAFLASDAASYIVGETIEINGGQLMR